MRRQLITALGLAALTAVALGAIHVTDTPRTLVCLPAAVVLALS